MSLRIFLLQGRGRTWELGAPGTVAETGASPCPPTGGAWKPRKRGAEGGRWETGEGTWSRGRAHTGPGPPGPGARSPPMGVARIGGGGRESALQALTALQPPCRSPDADSRQRPPQMGLWGTVWPPARPRRRPRGVGAMGGFGPRSENCSVNSSEDRQAATDESERARDGYRTAHTGRVPVTLCSQGPATARKDSGSTHLERGRVIS